LIRASGIALGAVRATYFDAIDRPSQNPAFGSPWLRGVTGGIRQ